MTGAALGVVWGLVRGNAAGWGSLEVVAVLAAGALLAVAFVAWELRAREPMLPMRLFRSRAFSGGNLATFFLFTSLFGAVFFFAQFLQTGLGYTPLEAGLRLLPWTATLFVVAPIAGALADRIGERPLIAGGLALQAVGLAWLALIADPGLAFSEIVLPSIITGVGASAAIPTSATAVVGAVGLDSVGKAAGANGMLRELGGCSGSPSRSPCSPAAAATPPPARSPTASLRRSVWRRASRSPERSPAWRCAAGPEGRRRWASRRPPDRRPAGLVSGQAGREHRRSPRPPAAR